MDFEQITYEQRGKVGLIMLNRPEKMNAWTPKMMAEMRRAMDAAVAEPSIFAIVVGANGRGFCAGADIGNVFAKRVEAIEAGSPEPDAATSDARASNWVDYLRSLPKPTIAAVQGPAVGIGVTQILPMDIRIAADNARFGFFFVKMGLVPELASSALLPQMVGTSRALEWCLTGRMIGATEAKEAGLVSEVVPADQLIERALAVGEVVANNPGPAMASIRSLLIANVHNDDVAAVQRSEGAALEVAYRTWQHKEAIGAFMEKRTPDFSKAP
jgi:enoyl-CoA hydratase/carnithine racemase